ncbi:MAG: hypothetical protein KGJ09_09715 [Candidatus Omnitrophica bacterium]|nr:hypothetical protein [Candidatus Omnitrophota bacterium]MDE2215385.1 hypothetical protein [Candidatus Omnitrophota bacterium]
MSNALIAKTMLGIEDHGLLTAMLFLEGDGWSQGFGGYCFGSHTNGTDEQNANLAIFIKRVLEIAGVSEWEKLPGKLVRIKKEGLNDPIRAIGHPLKNLWFNPQEEFQK